MGYQGGNARFTGTVGDINCYFDFGMELVRRTPRISRRTWYSSPRFKQQRACARVFGAAAVIAGRMWTSLPAGMRRLGDSSAYGRFVGAVRELVQSDGLLWDADLLGRMDLNLDSCGRSAFRRSGSGSASAENRVGGFVESGELKVESLFGGHGYQLVGIDGLMADLDSALGGAAGTMASVYVMAHPFWNDGFTHTEPMSEWRGGDTTNSVKANRIRKPIGYKRGKDSEVELPRCGGVWGMKHDGSGRLCGPLPIPEGFKRPQRRVRAWVHAVQVVDTVWNASSERFVLDPEQEAFSNGFVTDWLVIDDASPAAGVYDLVGRDWRTEWMEEGTYVVFTALEVAEKRGRHWVRLPWCSEFGVHSVEEIGSLNALEGLLKVESGKLKVEPQMGYLDASGRVVVVEDWLPTLSGQAAVGGDLRVWALEDLLGNAKLVASCERREAGFELRQASFGLGAVDLVASDGLVLLEVKGCGIGDFGGRGAAPPALGWRPFRPFFENWDCGFDFCLGGPGGRFGDLLLCHGRAGP